MATSSSVAAAPTAPSPSPRYPALAAAPPSPSPHGRRQPSPPQDTFTLTVTDNYLSWATANGVTGGANGDSDNDGVKNLVEYALVDGGERGVLSGNTITFTKRGAPYGTDLTYIIETSETLVGAWTDAVTHSPACSYPTRRSATPSPQALRSRNSPVLRC